MSRAYLSAYSFVSQKLIEIASSEYECGLPMSHENIANYLRLAPETVSRVISKFQHASVIDSDRAHIRLLDVARLGLVAQGLQSEKEINAALTNLIARPEAGRR